MRQFNKTNAEKREDKIKKLKKTMANRKHRLER